MKLKDLDGAAEVVLLRWYFALSVLSVKRFVFKIDSET